MISYKYNCKICRKGIIDYEHDYKDGMCFDCSKKAAEEKRAFRLQNDEETETLYEKDVVCPYCGYRIEDDEYYFLEEEYGEYDCPECEKTFTFQAHREITYCTQRKELKGND